MSVVVGANLTLAVDITGFNQPLTSVTWRRGATQLTNATTGVTIINSDLSISPATSMLTVSPVVSPSADAALYTVTAESPAGTSDVSFDVDVFGNTAVIMHTVALLLPRVGVARKARYSDRSCPSVCLSVPKRV